MFTSATYWEKRYRGGKTSGAGSYGRLAEFKAGVVNDFIRANDVKTVADFGCGDGNQLRLLQVPSYTGLDVSQTTLERLGQEYQGNPAYRFLPMDMLPKGATFDLCMSLDVIYHLVEDAVFLDYMDRLFGASHRHVIIYSSNHEAPYAGSHIRHREFTRTVQERHPNWLQTDRIANPHPWNPQDKQDTSFADFYVFRRGEG